MLVINIERPGTLVDVGGIILGKFAQVRGNLVVENTIREVVPEVVRETIHCERQTCNSSEMARFR